LQANRCRPSLYQNLRIGFLEKTTLYRTDLNLLPWALADETLIVKLKKSKIDIVHFYCYVESITPAECWSF
jgi:hypothetical protein